MNRFNTAGIEATEKVAPIGVNGSGINPNRILAMDIPTILRGSQSRTGCGCIVGSSPCGWLVGASVNAYGGTPTIIRRHKPPVTCHGRGVPCSRPGLSDLFLLFLLVILSSCGFPGVASTSQQLPVVNTMPTATSLPPVRFPQDEAPHRDLTEWWYYTGHMDAVTPDGKTHHYGFELVIFQALRSDFPPVYAAHYAISDVTRGEFHYDQRRLTEPDAVIPNGTFTRGMNLHVGNWTIQGVNGHDHLAAEMQNYAMNLTLQALKPPVLHNGNGLITYGLGGFSYYYSRTRMALSGTLIDHQQPLKVTGEAWMDHQWGNFLALGDGGWDWFSIQLNNFTEMMIYVIRDASGRTLSTYVGYIDRQAQDHLLPANALHVAVLSRWLSPRTGANYPSGWQIEINSPQIHSSLTLTPELKDQELLVYQSTGNTYWEGAVRITGQSAGNAVRGEGYVELTSQYPRSGPKKALPLPLTALFQ